MGSEFDQQVGEVGTGEGPLERFGGKFVALLEAQETILDLGEAGEIVGGEDLSLDDGEVDLDLVQPTGMNRRVNEDDGRPGEAQALGGLLAPMGGPVVGDPEDALGGAIRLLGHDLRDETIERLDACGFLAAPKDLGAMNVPGSEVGPSAPARILVLDARGPARGRSGRGVFAQAGLNTGLLVGRNDELLGTERGALPSAFVEIEHTTRLGFELGIAGEDPASVAPGADCITAEPAPKGSTADLSHDALGHDFTLDLGERESRQGKAAAVRQLTGERFDLNDDAGGKSGSEPRLAAVP